jgi:hypothetical protein
MKKTRRRVLIGASGLVAVVLVLTGAEAVTRATVESKISHAIACGMNGDDADVATHVEGSLVLPQVLGHRLEVVRVSIPWQDLVAAQAATGNAIDLSAATFDSEDGELSITTEVAGRAVTVLSTLGYTASSVTMTPESIIVGGFDIPVANLPTDRLPALAAATEPRTFSPHFPQGVSLTSAVPDGADLDIALRLAPTALDGAASESC